MLHKFQQVEENLGRPVTISNICMSESYLRVGSSIKETSSERKASQALGQGFFSAITLHFVMNPKAQPCLSSYSCRLTCALFVTTAMPSSAFGVFNISSLVTKLIWINEDTPYNAIAKGSQKKNGK